MVFLSFMRVKGLKYLNCPTGLLDCSIRVFDFLSKSIDLFDTVDNIAQSEFRRRLRLQSLLVPSTRAFNSLR